MPSMPRKILGPPYCWCYSIFFIHLEYWIWDLVVVVILFRCMLLAWIKGCCWISERITSPFFGLWQKFLGHIWRKWSFACIICGVYSTEKKPTKNKKFTLIDYINWNISMMIKYILCVNNPGNFIVNILFDSWIYD